MTAGASTSCGATIAWRRRADAWRQRRGAPTSCGATTLTPNGQNIVWGENCDTAACDNVVWGNNIVWGETTRATTSCGATPTPTTSCGAISHSTTSSGANSFIRQHRVGQRLRRRRLRQRGLGQHLRQHRLGQRRRLDNIVWGNTASLDNVVWGNRPAMKTSLGKLAATKTPVYGDDTAEVESARSDGLRRSVRGGANGHRARARSGTGARSSHINS